MNSPTGIHLPSADGTSTETVLREPRDWPDHPQPHQCRVAFAAAHVAADPLGDNTPGGQGSIDWESTLAFRRELFRYGFGVAEAMDTAQRNMGLSWPAARELIERSAEQARACGARIASGAGTDHWDNIGTLSDVTSAYSEQAEVIEQAGSQVIVMASRQLAAIAGSPDDYRKVYSTILRQVSRPVILHWLGEAFDPQLAGYWGCTDIPAATATFLDIVRDNADKVDGVKVSLLSLEHERELRAALPAGVRCYTGDDFHYPELIRGTAGYHSDALLGAFALTAPSASAALTALEAGDLAGYEAEMGPGLALSRHVFTSPTFHYKTGIAFLAWLAGHQRGFTMLGGMHSGRSVPHLARVFALANEARLLPDPELASHRMRLLLETSGALT